MRGLKPREMRLLILLLIAAGIAAWKFIPRPWSPTDRVGTSHYLILSTAPRERVNEVGGAVEALYLAYSNSFRALPSFRSDHPPLRLKLYCDRAEMRRVNPGLGWAEAFYREPYSHAYYSSEENNPIHWMTHEVTHQLNSEVARTHPAKWLEEGVADYFGTSRIANGMLHPGAIDVNTYPLWWLDLIATSPDLDNNLKNGSVIPLRSIITGRGGPSMNRNVNLYYLHWWTLTHFIFENHSNVAPELVHAGGKIDSVERLIGPLDTVQAQWHTHVRRIKAAVAGHDPQFLKTGKLPLPDL